MKTITAIDLQHIYSNTIDVWSEIAGKNVLITGGTGFFGKWLISSFIYANSLQQLNANLFILSRNPKSFLEKHPSFAHPNVVYLEGDIVAFDFPEVPLHYIIHAATEANLSLIINEPLLMFDTIVSGTKNILDLAVAKQVTAFLLTSSGAIYGKQPVEVSHLPEDSNIAADVFSKDASYGEGKRVAEMLCSIYFNQHKVDVKIARCFAFAGPYLPIDAHYALGNFIKDAVNGCTININGDGSPYRSYLYAADLVIWLWTILLKGKPNTAYNVGSDEEITILELGKKISALSANAVQVNVKEKPNNKVKPQRYVPSILRAKNDLGLKVLINIDTSLKRTFEFYDQNN